jgi:hypothetical protein
VRALIIRKFPKSGTKQDLKMKLILRRLKENTANVTLNQKSYPQGNVQRCSSNPQEKRAQAQEKKLKSQIQKRKIKETN